MIKPCWRVVLVVWCFGALLFSGAAAGEPERGGQPYERVRYPTFSTKENSRGRLKTLLEADKAEVYDATGETPRIRLENVVITIYNLDNAEDLPKNLPPPVEMLITSDLGFFTRSAEPGHEIEEIANLEGNVVMQQMRLKAKDDDQPLEDAIRPRAVPDATRKSDLPPGVETVIKCQHAQWNHTQGKLTGEGPVEFIQEGSRIEGTNFLYIVDSDAIEGGAASTDIKDWGGIVFIEHNARMEIDRAGSVSIPGVVSDDTDRKTVITCTATASYKLREKEIQFEKDVRVRRQGLEIESDILKVFLRHEDDPLPESRCGEGETPLPGQVKNIVATIGSRPGSVVITGYRIDKVTGKEELMYSAKGGRADFDYDTNRIALTDSREHSWPVVEFGPTGSDRITDKNLTFVFRPFCKSDGQSEPGDDQAFLDSLTTSGGQGEVVLRTRHEDPNMGPSVTTRVNYRGDMEYSREDGRIRFTDRVVLKRGDSAPGEPDELVINSDLLDIKLDQTDTAGMELSRLQRIVAETNVAIQAGDYTAKAERAEYELHPGPSGYTGTDLDTLRLFGPPQSSVQTAEVKDHQGNVITAPEIHMQRLSGGSHHRDQHLVVARGGVSTFQFVPDPAADARRFVSIRCERGIEYNQVSKKARFEGGVTATSDAPEDNYVLTSDRLVIDFEESPDPADPAEFQTWIRRITAEGNARLIQDRRICEAENIIRDFPSNDARLGDIYLQGIPAQGDRRPQPAVYREQDGQTVLSQFVAPLIKSSARGDLIQANGPGELSMPDDGVPLGEGGEGNLRASINFAGAASYESFMGGDASEAKFWGGVRLSQPSRRIVVVSEELDARFVKDDAVSTFAGTTAAEIDIDRIGRLRRVEARNGVRIVSATSDRGRQTAEGDIGVVEFTGSGNIVRLTASREGGQRRFVTAKNDRGMTIRSPEIEIREAQGITRASGPGDLQIPPDQGEGMAKVPTRVLYGENGAMVYNELALNIRVTNNVRVVQPGAGNNWSSPNLDGICERLDITLAEPPADDMSGTEALSRVLRMDAIGSVLLRIYAEAPEDNPNMDWYARPGTTFFTRGDQAVYDVPKGEISIFCLDNRQPQLLMNIVEENKPPRRQRLKADRFVLFTNPPRRWNFQGQLDSSAIRDGEPFDFVGQ